MTRLIIIYVFSFNSYQEFIRETIQRLPRQGRGELLRLANYISIHTSTLSQVLALKKHFTLEQACLAAEFFGLNELETSYFIIMVNRDRAGTTLLRRNFEAQLHEIKLKSSELKDLLPQDRPLTQEEKAIFYSNWFYTAIWAQTSIDGFNTKETLEKYFKLPRKLINEVIYFLLQTGLCIEKNGLLSPGHQYTHLEAGSPLVSRHHSNWRVKAMEKHPNLSQSDLCYSAPMTLSNKDVQLVKHRIGELISEINKIRDPSLSEELYCLNIDWIKI
jgi:hypothetical protein